MLGGIGMRCIRNKLSDDMYWGVVKALDSDVWHYSHRYLYRKLTPTQENFARDMMTTEILNEVS